MMSAEGAFAQVELLGVAGAVALTPGESGDVLFSRVVEFKFGPANVKFEGTVVLDAKLGELAVEFKGFVVFEGAVVPKLGSGAAVLVAFVPELPNRPPAAAFNPLIHAMAKMHNRLIISVVSENN